MKNKPASILFGMLLFGFVGCSVAPSRSNVELDQFLNHYFDSWSRQDMVAYEKCFFPSATIYFIGENSQVVSIPLPEFILSQKQAHATSTSPMKEVPLKKLIQINSQVAQAEVTWKLTKGQQVVLGTDFFTLLETSDGWRILSLVFRNDTMQ